MSNDFWLIQANNLENSITLASMHSLRRTVFIDELQWTAGLQVIRDMEFDEYDQPDTYYIIHLDKKGEVDAACRLNPTSKPYMIAEHYPEFVEDIPLPHSNTIWEISRFCASKQARTDSKGRITGQLIAAALEFGLAKGVTNYVALATDHLLPIIKRIGGWDPTPLGPKKHTPNDVSYSVIYTVSQAMLEHVRKKNHISGALLFEIQTNPNKPKGDIMEEKPYAITRIPKQIGNEPGNQMEEMERTLSYLEAMAFARDYQSILSGLRFTRIVLQCDKYGTPLALEHKKNALVALDTAYLQLKKQLEEIDEAAKHSK